jgi:hypothetical protein
MGFLASAAFLCGDFRVGGVNRFDDLRGKVLRPLLYGVEYFRG